MKDFPKVLLVCSFNKDSANGITINNLFKAWPNDKIAVAFYHSSIDNTYVPNIRNYYRIGDKESSFIRPFNLIRKIPTSKVYTLNKSQRNKEISESKISKGLMFKLKTQLKKISTYMLNLTGLSFVIMKFNVSVNFEKWVNNFNPDIIYATMENLSTMEFSVELKKTFKRPLAIHVFDDFVNSSYKFAFHQSYWKNKLNDSFKDVLSNSELNFSISEKMAEEYKKKYGVVFYSFHNPIDFSIWGNLNQLKTKNEKFTFLYAGKVNRDTNSTIISLYNSIESLNTKGFKIEFHLYSPYKYSVIYSQLGSIAEKIYKGNAPYNKLPDLFRNADALFLPLNFEKNTIKYIRLSMLTKATEYMISGTPIFLFAPKNVAVTEYLSNNEAAFIVNDENILEDSIIKFIEDESLRKNISSNAIALAKEKHLSTSVSENLRLILQKQLSD